MGLEPGTRVNEHIRLLRHLGRGGMGSVWVARHEKLLIDVAVKFVAADLLKADDPRVLSRFQREAQLAAKLDNGHAVRILDHGVSAEAGPYIVMELLEGQSLAERLQVDKRLSVEEAAQIVSEVAEGLEHAHALGIVHRDIKPPNLFLSRARDGRSVVKIVDFGIAKSSAPTEANDMATSSGVLIGTPQYMSPEQLMHAGPADKRADVWALSVVAYQMITGHLPFVGETLAATLVAITRADVAPPTKTVPGLAGALDGFFRRAFSIEPERRFADARSLSDAFRAAAAGTPAFDLPTMVSPLLASDTDASLPTAEFLLRQRSPLLAEGSPEHVGTGSELGFAPTHPALPADGQRVVRRPARTKRVLLALVAAFGLAVGVYALRRSGQAPQEALAPQAPLSEAHVGSPAPPAATTPMTSARALPAVGAINKLAVPAGTAELTSLFVPAFELAREEGDGNATFMGAVAACERRRMALCTESQWLRACEVHAALGREPSWTLTASDASVVVRGGAGCSSHGQAPADSAVPERIAACCSRSVSVRSSNNNVAFLGTTAAKVLSIERSLNAANGLELAAMSLPKLNFFGKIMEKDEIVKTAAWVGRSATFYFDNCDVAISDLGLERRWTAECVGVLRGSKEARRAFRWITIADGGLISELREPKQSTSLTGK